MLENILFIHIHILYINFSKSLNPFLNVSLLKCIWVRASAASGGDLEGTSNIFNI